MSTLICPDCNYQTDKNELFCSNCGAKLVPVCPSCGAELKPNALFCSQCGAETEKKQKNEGDISAISHPETKEASDPVQPSSSQLAVEQDNRPQYDNNKKQAHVFAQQFSEEGKQSKRTNNQFYDKESIKKIAFYHKVFLILFLLNFLINGLWAYFEKSEYGYILSVYAIPVLIASILFVTFPAIVALIYLRNELKGNIVLTVIISMFLFIPFVNILFAAIIISRGSKVLKAASYKVGSLGVSWKDVKALVNDGSDFWKKNLRVARVYYLITLALVAVSCFINYLYLDEIYYNVGNSYMEEAKKDSEKYPLLSSLSDSKFKTAVLLYKKAAEKGNAMAQYELGLCYEGGIGVKKDNNEAKKWLRRAAEQGHAEAQYNLGIFYVAYGLAGAMLNYGDKHDDDAVEAIKWFSKAAEQGHAEAQFVLGSIYEKGVEGIVKQDKTEAVKWYNAAAEQGDENAKAALKQLGY